MSGMFKPSELHGQIRCGADAFDVDMDLRIKWCVVVGDVETFLAISSDSWVEESDWQKLSSCRIGRMSAECMMLQSCRG